jgi:hypothetical protein
MELSTTIRLTEAAIDQAVTEDQPINHETIRAIQDTMIEWAQAIEQMEAQHQSDRAEIAELRSLLRIPEGMSKPTIRFDNIVPIIGRIGETGGAA